MCEETAHYFWALQDVLGHGATSQVYKAYNKTTGELVAAKVYQASSSSRSARDGKDVPKKDYRPILEREMEILQAADHENIVRYISLEPLLPIDESNNREALMIEYCNGASLTHVLSQPENRYGLKEDEFMLVFKHLTQALKYLHDKHTIHRDIKPDNIMLSININGERTYKLADLGVARLINEGENAFTSLVGTEEYIHPELYRAAVRDNKNDVLRTAFQTRVDFPFEVDLWSLAVTLYQCATGELPFQPYAGTRKDRLVMRRILDTKPSGIISGIELKSGGDIQWSNKLPESCRLSNDLKQRLENLLQRLLESNRNKLMSFREFFSETDRIFSLIPIYYLNLKRFILTCHYFHPDDTVCKFENVLKESNEDEEYFCLFQNISFPILKNKTMTIKTMCERLPIPTSREVPLVFYTFSPLRTDDLSSLRIHTPDVKPIRQYNDVAAAYNWSRDMVGLFFYIKNQLIDYQHILQTAQCSTTIMHEQLKLKHLDFLCLIRSKLIVFRAIEELKNILDQIDHHTLPMTKERNPSSSTIDGNSLVFPQPNNSNCSSTESSLSPISTRRTSSTSSMPVLQQSIRIYLRSYLQPYERLKNCEQQIMEIIQEEFSSQTGLNEDEQPFGKTLWLSHRTKTYASWNQRADKFLKDLIDLNESFRKDSLLHTYNRLQSDSHFRRRKNLEELHEKYLLFVNNECSPNLIQIFHDYNKWINERRQLLLRFHSIEESYRKQCDDILDYVEMIDDVREIVYKNIRDLSQSNSLNMNPPITINDARLSSGDELDESTNKKLMKKLRGKTKKHFHQAEEGIAKLDQALRQFRHHIQKH